MKKNHLAQPAFVLNVMLVICGFIGLIISCINLKASMFEYYTQDSNIFCLISALIYVIASIRAQKAGKELPKWVAKVRYLATCTVTVTFLVVIFVLAPMFENILYGYYLMFFNGANFFYHVTCPLLSIVSYVFWEHEDSNEARDPLIALIPTAVYAAVTIVLNILRLIEGPYPFLMVHQQTPLASVAWCATILLIAWLIAVVIRGMHNRNYARFMKYEKEN